MNEPTPGRVPAVPPAQPSAPRRPLAAPSRTTPARPAPYATTVPPGAGVPPPPDDTPAQAESRADGPAHAAAPADESAHGEAPEDDGPQPLGLRVEPTGHAPVDDGLRRLEDADHLAVSGHLEVYEDVHRGLRDTLTALDRHDPHPRS